MDHPVAFCPYLMSDRQIGQTSSYTDSSEEDTWGNLDKKIFIIQLDLSQSLTLK